MFKPFHDYFIKRNDYKNLKKLIRNTFDANFSGWEYFYKKKDYKNKTKIVTNNLIKEIKINGKFTTAHMRKIFKEYVIENDKFRLNNRDEYHKTIYCLDILEDICDKLEISIDSEMFPEINKSKLGEELLTLTADSRKEFERAVKRAIFRGADVNYKSPQSGNHLIDQISAKMTPLYQAVLNNKTKTIKLLISHGADIHSIGTMGQNAITLALNNKRGAILIKTLIDIFGNVDQTTKETIFKYYTKFPKSEDAKEIIDLLNLWQDPEFKKLELSK